MTIGFPTNTVIWIVAAMIGLGISSWFALSRGLQRSPLSPAAQRAWSWGAAVVLSVWFFARLALALNAPGNVGPEVSVTIAFVIAGLLLGIVPFLLSPGFRQAIRAIPETWVVGIHAIRVGGFVFLALLDMGLLPAQFAVPAGYGDMTVGLLSLVIVYLLGQHKPYARTLAIAWNLLGLLDLVTALTTGPLFLGPFAAQLAGAGVSLSYLYYVFMIPTFGVPILAILHLYSLFQLLSVPVGRKAPAGSNPVHAPAE